MFFEDVRIRMYVFGFGFAAAAGLATMFRPGAERLTLKSLFGSMLNSGLAGLITTLFCMSWEKTAGNTELILASATLVGFGGNKSIDTLVSVGQEIIASIARSAATKFTKPPTGNPPTP